MGKEILYETRYLSVVEDADGWEYVERCGSFGVVQVVAVTDDGKLVLVEQYRAPIGRRVVGLPAGLVEATGAEAACKAAKWELLEETGYEAEGMIEMTVGPQSAGLSSEMATMFYAYDLKKVESGGGLAEEGESIKVHEVPLIYVEDWLARKEAAGVPIAMTVWAGICFARRMVG